MTTTLYNIIQSELINEGFNEFVDSNGNLVFFDEDSQFMTKILSYDKEVSSIVDKLFSGNKLIEPEYDEHFKKTFLYRFINRKINRQTVESFKLELLSTFMMNRQYLNSAYEDAEKFITNSQISDVKINQTNRQLNDGVTTSDNRSAFADLPQSTINLDVDNYVISSANDNTVTRNKQKNTQETDGITTSETTSDNKTYNLDNLLKTNGLFENVFNVFDIKCFNQIW